MSAALVARARGWEGAPRKIAPSFPSRDRLLVRTRMLGATCSEVAPEATQVESPGRKPVAKTDRLPACRLKSTDRRTLPGTARRAPSPGKPRRRCRTRSRGDDRPGAPTGKAFPQHSTSRLGGRAGQSSIDLPKSSRPGADLLHLGNARSILLRRISPPEARALTGRRPSSFQRGPPLPVAAFPAFPSPAAIRKTRPTVWRHPSDRPRISPR